MKVLHILDISLPHRQSGYSLRSQYIINTQKDLGFDPVVLTRWGVSEQLADGVEYIDDVPYLRNTSEEYAIRMGERLGKFQLPDTPRIYHVGQTQHFRKRVVRAVEAEKPDVLHAASPGKNAQVAIDIGHHYGLPVVYEVRGLWHDSGVAQGMLVPDSEAYRQQHMEHVNAMRQADAVVTLSEVLKAECIREGVDEDKIGVVPNGVAVEQYAPKDRSRELGNRIGIELGDVVLGYIGLVRSLEGLRLLLQACEVLRGRYANLKVLIVGGGRDLPALQREAHERGLSDVVIFTGEIPHDQIAAYYAMLDVFVVPRTRSRVTELVTPMKPYEAMAMEKAVVVSDVAALTEVVTDGETGRVFAADDVESLIQTCAELIENPALRMQLGQKGSEWVRSERAWTRVVEGYRGIYESAIEVCPAREECINPQAKTRTRVAFYSQHLIGVGHHFRNRQIVNGLVKTCDVFFLDGGRPISGADLDERVTRISLPPLRTGAQGIEPVDKESDLQAVMHERQVRLSKAMEQICPDVFCVEFFPFSRWSLKSEILNTIIRLNQINPGAKVLCSLRDIPTRAKSDKLQPTVALAQRRDGDAIRFYSVPFGGIHHEYMAFNRRYYEEVVPTLNQYFDAVMVHGDSQLSRLEDHFPWVDDIGIPVVYTGFISEKLKDASRPDGAPNRYVLVSAGGGVEGLALVAPCIEAWKQLDRDDALDGREMVIFAGAFIDETHFDALRELCGDGPFHIERFTSNFLAWMKHADLSISRAGYNTCMNVLETQVPSLLVPSIAMDDQEFRAQQLMGLGIAQVIHPDQLDVTKMAKTVAEMLKSSVPEHHLSMDGAVHTRKFIDSGQRLAVSKTKIAVSR